MFNNLTASESDHINGGCYYRVHHANKFSFNRHSSSSKYMTFQNNSHNSGNQINGYNGLQMSNINFGSYNTINFGIISS